MALVLVMCLFLSSFFSARESNVLTTQPVVSVSLSMASARL
jgi:hypothetical protein